MAVEPLVAVEAAASLAVVSAEEAAEAGKSIIWPIGFVPVGFCISVVMVVK